MPSILVNEKGVDDLLDKNGALEAEVRRLTAELKEKGEYGYSQEVVNALTQERDRLRIERDAALERERRLREALNLAQIALRNCARTTRTEAWGSAAGFAGETLKKMAALDGAEVKP